MEQLTEKELLELTKEIKVLIREIRELAEKLVSRLRREDSIDLVFAANLLEGTVVKTCIFLEETVPSVENLKIKLEASEVEIRRLEETRRKLRAFRPAPNIVNRYGE